MKHADTIVLVFSKAPVAGEVNTRLTPYISHQEAADLQCELVHNRLEMLASSGLCHFQLWCAPDTLHPFFADCADRYGIDLQAQTGIDLGERMLSASRLMLESYDKVIIIGTDAPALGIDQIDQAISESVRLYIAPACWLILPGAVDVCWSKQCKILIDLVCITVCWIHAGMLTDRKTCNAIAGYRCSSISSGLLMMASAPQSLILSCCLI